MAEAFPIDGSAGQLPYRTRRRVTEFVPDGIRQSCDIDQARALDHVEDDLLDDKWRKLELATEHRSSRPFFQFQDQVEEERVYTYGYDPRGDILSSHYRQTSHPVLRSKATHIIKERWIEQGIWRDEWNGGHPIGRWKHEEPVWDQARFEAELDDCPVLEPKTPRATTTGLPTGKEETGGTENRQLAKEREASRPCNQFRYQVEKEIERVEQEKGNEVRPRRLFDQLQMDSKTLAHKIVRSLWVRRGIWDEAWGAMPGQSWKHERPLTDLFDNDPVLKAPPREADRAEYYG